MYQIGKKRYSYKDRIVTYDQHTALWMVHDPDNRLIFRGETIKDCRQYINKDLNEKRKQQQQGN